MHSYIYLIQTGDFINTNIYKIGRTTEKTNDTRSLNRLKSYSKNTIQKFLYEVPTLKVIEIEKEIIKEFNCKYQLKQGHEWFHGDCKNMITDINTIISKYVISDNSTIENKPSTNVLINKIKKDKLKHKPKKLSCNFCSKKFKTTYNTNRHETVCKKENEIKKKAKENTEHNLDKIIKNKVNNIINDKMNNIITMLKELGDKITINNNTIVNNTKNVIQINIYKTKKDKLNQYYNNTNTIDATTFIQNYKTNPKYQLNKEESKKLLEVYKNNGPDDFVDCLHDILLEKYHMQLTDLSYDTTRYILPFLGKDCNFRTHFEFSESGWILTKSDNNLIDLIKITKNQIFDHCYEFMKLPSKRGFTTIYHYLLKKMDYNRIELEMK
jgi:hypothetical protein